MLPEDRNTFLGFVQEHDPVSIVLRDADSPEVRPLTDLKLVETKTLSLWNSALLPRLERKWVPDPGYYVVDGLRTPTLEFSSSLLTAWEGKPALIQGRLFGDFDSNLNKPRAFEKWYEMLSRWIRKNYRKSPARRYGYIGPAAYDFYSKGGYLLPQFLPPRTDAWLTEIGRQHSRTPTRRGRR